MVRLLGIGIVYPARGGPVPAVRDFDADFRAGTITAIIGPSGCGKTSLLQTMAGLRAPTTGRVLIEGAPLGGVRSRTAVIFQDYGLLPWKTVRDNAELPLLLRGMDRRQRRVVVDPILEELGLSQFVRLYPSGLSGGMRQRLAVARALATSPDLLLMDEPFSSLDALTRESLQEMLLAVHGRHEMTTIIVTHSIEEAAYLSDVVLVMGGRNPGGLLGSIAAGHPRRDEPRFLDLTTKLRAMLVEGAKA
jgi:NitT/TauT family transport system ATP-binding protein